MALAASMPIDDPQFWVATVAVISVAAAVAWRLRRRRGRPQSGACEHCAEASPPRPETGKPGRG